VERWLLDHLLWTVPSLLDISERYPPTGAGLGQNGNGYRDAADGDMGEIRPVVWVSASWGFESLFAIVVIKPPETERPPCLSSVDIP
jgi:hypothetical protein